MAEPVDPPSPVTPPPPPPTESAAGETAPPRRSRWRLLAWLPAVLIILVVLYYLIGMFMLNVVDDDAEFGSATVTPEGGSHSVAIAADLIEREIDTHRWVANDPFFMPGYLLDNTPNFQQGIIAALSRFAVELTDQIARNRGSSQVDKDAETASGLLKYPGDVWVFNFAVSIAPTASSEKQYGQALRALRAYNQRLAEGNASFEPRADNLQATLERFNADIGSSSASIDRHIEENSGFGLDFHADDLFYTNKGRLYAYYLLMRGLAVDFDRVIQERDLASVWQQTVDSLRQAAQLQPWVVVNGSPDGQFLPSHLAAQGFYLLRARTQLKEITNILLK
jgi:hypothetical protein